VTKALRSRNNGLLDPPAAIMHKLTPETGPAPGGANGRLHGADKPPIGAGTALANFQSVPERRRQT